MALVIKRPGIEDFFDNGGDVRAVKMLIIGYGGAGKTPWASYAPKPLFAVCGPGVSAVADATDRMEYARVVTWADMEALLDQIRLQVAKGSKRWETLVIDTIDDFQDNLREQWRRQNRSEAFAGNQAWNWLGTKMDSFMQALQRLPINVIILMHPKTLNSDEDSTELAFAPRLKGDIRDTILNMWDLIGLMESGFELVGDKTVRYRRIRWEATPRFPMLRDRFRALPATSEVTFDPSDFTKIFGAIHSTAEKRQLRAQQKLETIPTEDDRQPEKAAQGGPVKLDPQAAQPARRVAGKKATVPPRVAKPGMVVQEISGSQEVPAAPETPVSGSGAQEAPKEDRVDLSAQPATDVPVSEAPEAAPVDLQTATETVEEVLGGLVIEEHGVAERQAGEVRCGDLSPNYRGTPRTVNSCGRTLSIGGVTVEGQNPDRIQVSALKTGHLMCNGCWETERSDMRRS